ncbi:MAG: trigger factor [Beijerinckiaceae bacterium]|nr:trigger factor [Beijerinckiaceae bacterium]
MQVTQTLSDGLKREFKVVLPAKDLADRLAAQLEDLKDKVQIKGFRPGKVPASHLRRVYGRSVMGDLVQELVNEGNRRIIEEHKIKLAMQPEIVFPEEKEKVEAIMEARGDLEYTVKAEVLPEISVSDFSGIKVTREVAEVPETEVDEAIKRMADQNKPFTPKKDGAKAAKGDRVVIDFVGKIDGVPFDGGTGTDIPVELGSGSFIPGFEDQLIGVKKDDTLVINATFPENYNAAHLAGKAATFDTTVKAVEEPGEVTIDDEFAKGFGLEDLAKLKDAIKGSILNEWQGVARRKLKKQLLDALDGQYTFELPPTLVEQEFNGIWGNVEAEMKAAGRTFADEDTTEEEARAEYKKIAERRVRLGLVLAEIGEQAKIQITDEELTQGVIERARQFPGQEKMVWDFYRKNPQAMAEIRAPIFEEKVIDHILASAKVTDKSVSKDELLKEEDDSEADKPKAKKAKAKKAEA